LDENETSDRWRHGRKSGRPGGTKNRAERDDLHSWPGGYGKISLALALCHERTGVKIEEGQTIQYMGRVYASHVHAGFSIWAKPTNPKLFFYTPSRFRIEHC